MITLRRHALAALTVAAALALAGCASGGASTDAASSAAPTPTASAGPELTGELTIFAAASLSGAFDELATQFEQLHPGLDVAPISYDGSSVLATQLLGGATVDVFASADEKNMAKVTDAALAAAAAPFATNTLEIAVAPGNPKKISSLQDLAAPGLTVVVCAAEVPCGSAAQKLLTAAGVALTPASEEQNVTAVLTKVKSGEADAGLVYRTDVTAAGDAVSGVEIDGADAATNVYPIAALTAAPNPEAARAFVAFVLSADGQKVLKSFGFGAP
ncbi:MAG: molybdate ABC transporter substrate-binding protein [Microbacterium sp.]|uniref:molybdate ABC transporter substrate-binding protein n=1 Tax=Microbacterium sp. TaxID=51671 RepID=UPI001ACA44B8|nr:molybdate ABC transporter substrate-binding protein [Microbacterium sp.]MBN9177537.1 molybdate ABC transporter substrate-binding protein [Microbacterium sp.]